MGENAAGSSRARAGSGAGRTRAARAVSPAVQDHGCILVLEAKGELLHAGTVPEKRTNVRLWRIDVPASSVALAAGNGTGSAARNADEASRRRPSRILLPREASRDTSELGLRVLTHRAGEPISLLRRSHRIPPRVAATPTPTTHDRGPALRPSRHDAAAGQAPRPTRTALGLPGSRAHPRMGYAARVMWRLFSGLSRSSARSPAPPGDGRIGGLGLEQPHAD